MNGVRNNPLAELGWLHFNSIKSELWTTKNKSFSVWHYVQIEWGATTDGLNDQVGGVGVWMQ